MVTNTPVAAPDPAAGPGREHLGGNPAVVRTRWFRREAAGRAVCELCPRACSLDEGQRGLCFVRACQGGEIVLTSYGRSTGFCIDPIEKKPLYHFLPGSAVLSFGTAGCNLACRFCQNWETSRSRAVESMCASASPADIARAAEAAGCPSVALTYNDPVVFHEYAIDVADACRERGIKVVAVTAGYVNPEPRREFYQRMDAANVDLKAFSERFYRELCGGDLHTVLDTLVYLRSRTSVWVELTTLLVPGENDGDAELDELSRWVHANLGADVPLHFSAFHPDFKMRDKPFTKPAALARARQIAIGNGLRHVYTGNVRDEEGGSTACSACGQRVIGRDGYRLTAWGLDAQGCCTACGHACPGVWAGPPGDWGNRRLPVAIGEHRCIDE